MAQERRSPRAPSDHSENGPSSRSSGRRRHSRSFSASSGVLYAVAVIGVSILLACLLWIAANDVLALNKESTSATITVNDESDFGSVADQLKGNDIIKHKGLFKLFASLTGGKDKIAQGTYEVNSDMDYRALLNSMSSNSASRKDISVTITEGQTLKQIFELLEKEGVSTVEKLEDMAANHDYAFSFLQDIPLGDPTRLEGYLFPDTYKFYMGEDPKYVINKMLVNFDSKVDDAVRQKISETGYSIRDILTIASMIEKETDGTDRTTIASVIYNRLNNPGASTAGYLQIDATIQYVLPEGKIVQESDYQGVDSPYNTYKKKGLPPGPIANPGMESITAALNPQSTNYYYYALGDDHLHHFFSSYAEHQAFLNS